MRIDSSGFVVIGATAQGSQNAVTLSPTGYVQARKASGAAGFFDRLTNDGTIIQLRKGGADVGSIGVAQSGDRTYFSGGSYGVASDTSEATIMPCGTTGTGNDGVVSLGKSDARFKDGHFSGNLYGNGSNLTGVGGSTAYGAVGTYTAGYIAFDGGDTSQDITRNDTVSGSAILTAIIGSGNAASLVGDFSNTEFPSRVTGSSLSGTWRAMTNSNSKTSDSSRVMPAVLFVRIS
jgi:hypothetical protein